MMSAKAQTGKGNLSSGNGEKSITFQKRHFDSVAYVLRQSNAPDHVVFAFCSLFEYHNPKFSRDKFLSACRNEQPKT